MPDDLYERDVLLWAERQADLLRRLAAGERVNDAVDWPNVIEEVRDVGLSELRTCKSLLVQALAHLLKLHAWPDSPGAAHWRGETAAFLAGARRSFTSSMRQRIDVAGLYDDARYQVQAGAGDPANAPSLPETCPFTLDDLLAIHPGIADLVARLGE
jgi:Domain of unknown function DUF29